MRPATASPTEPRQVALSPAAVRALAAAAATAWPCEMVALLAGSMDGDLAIVERCCEVRGALTGPDHFAVPPAAFAGAEAAARAAGLQWLGFAHSHPDGEPRPSATDRAELWRGCVQIVGGGPAWAPHWRAFWFVGDTVRELPLSTLPALPAETAR